MFVLKDNYLPVPHYWDDITKRSIFDWACFGVIPDIEGHKSDEQNEDGFTVAMILAWNEIDVPKEW